MTREEIIDGLELYTIGRLKKERVYITVEELQSFIDAIKALKEDTSSSEIPTSSDCVDRHSVDLLACRYLKEPTDNHVAFYEHFLDLPSVTPIRPKGHWIERELVGDVFKFKDSRKILICSNCKMGIAKEILGMSNFCPNCGAEIGSKE